MKMVRVFSIITLMLVLASCGKSRENKLLERTLKNNTYMLEQEISKAVGEVENVVKERGNRPEEVELIEHLHASQKAYTQLMLDAMSDFLQIGNAKKNYNRLLEEIEKGQTLLEKNGMQATLDTAQLDEAMALFEQSPEGVARYMFLNLVAKEVLDHTSRLSVLVGSNCCGFFLPRFSYTSQVDSLANGFKHQVSLNPMDPFVIQECEVSYDNVEVVGGATNLKKRRIGNALLLEFESNNFEPFELKCEGEISQEGDLENIFKQGFYFKLTIQPNSSNYR